MVLFLQLLVFFLDSKTHRWFRLQGVGTLQPSEFAKPALIIFFAYFVTQKREAINTRRTIGGRAGAGGAGGDRRDWAIWARRSF